jgi:hypothetical protein
MRYRWKKVMPVVWSPDSFQAISNVAAQTSHFHFDR